MRKVTTICAAFLCAVSISYGQHEVGVKAGYNYLMTNYVNPFEAGPIETDGGGFHLGGYYNFSPMDNFFIGGELLISNRSWNAITSDGFDGSTVTTMEERYTHFSNTYLEIPLLAKYGINMRQSRYGGNTYLLFYTGPSAHFLMATKGTTQETFRIDAHDQTTVMQSENIYTKAELKNYFSPFQLGINAGISFSFEFGLTIDARFQTMLMPTNRVQLDFNDDSIGENQGLIRQNMLQFSVGYNFLRD